MADSIVQALRSRRLALQLIATGTLSPDEEIEAREASAQVAEMLFNATRDPSRLTEATQHYQAIIRLLKTPSPRRAKFLDKLAYLEMTVFDVTKSMKVLDDSIAHSKQARDEAPPTDTSLLRKIYENLGYSVSHRAQLKDDSADLDEAIACGREVLRLSSPADVEHQLSTNNLAARLQARYKMHHRAVDADEALSLIEEQLHRFQPGAPQHGAALLVRAQILHDRYEQTKNIEHLEHAIAGFKVGLRTVGMTHERAPEILRLLSILHNQRYTETNAVADLAVAVEYSKTKLQLIPRTYQTRPDHVADYLTHLVEYILVVDSLVTVEKAVEEARALRDEVPKAHTKRHSTNLSLTGILSKRCQLSQGVRHLAEVVSHALDSIDAWNEKLNITQSKVPTEDLRRFSTFLRKVEVAPEEAPVRHQALEQLFKWHLVVHQSRTPLDTIVNMAHRHGDELNVFSRNFDSNERLSEEQIRSGIEVLQKETSANNAEDGDRRARLRAFNRDDHTDPFFGHRQLAVDPLRKRLIVSMEGLVKSVLGYSDDEEEPKSWAEYEAREARLERESFVKDKKQGKFPNPKLCRVCRHVKLLKPSDHGAKFTWNTEQYFPFGTYAQLLTRKHCSICRLVLSLCSADRGSSLHPQLAQIDREIQGTQFHAQKLPSGEILLGVEYGMITVGALRIVNQRNLPEAVRQTTQASTLRSVLENAHGAGLPVDQGDQRIDIQKIRGWLYDCHINHGELCNDLDDSQRYADDIPLILVDVQENCLVSATSAERYFTLSYVWGKVDIATTTRALLKDRLQKSSLDPAKFPNTIRDAMTVVQAMGERYLWTDALCIIQDDAVIRERDITRMDIVYKKAFANLVALSGTDAGGGLPGATTNSRPPQKIEVLQITKGSKDLGLRDEPGAETEAVYIVATPHPLSSAQTSSMWNTRGWILQEQTLARRNIYFSSNYVYFQCNEKTLCEVTLEGKYINNPKDDEDDEDQTTGFTIKNPVSELRKLHRTPPQDHLKGVFKAYSELVEIYSTRKLTLPTDILDAFSGMLSAFKEEFKSETLHGLPIAALDLALLRTPSETLKKRPGRKPTDTSPSAAAGSNSSAPATTGQTFPTWSWAGWIGGVDYRLLPLDKEPPPESLIAEIYILRAGKILCLRGYQRPCLDETAKASPELLRAYFGRMSMEVRQAMPDTILHMFVPHVMNAGFSICTGRAPDYLSNARHVYLQTKQAVVRIHDEHGKHCDILFEHIDYHALLAQISSSFPTETKTLRDHIKILRTLDDKAIVAVSQSKDVYGDRATLSRVEGDIKRFDPYEFPAKGPDSALVNVLVLQSGDGAFERVAVGQIHIKAWREAGPRRAWVKIG
ncbi:hypothetical protein A1O7_07608 [Cladophialophora yegresii CBS 114405]|uniref:Heterokaryon incompatibility domain-containing protein n=1 Tax=Cladophialophora yegresii CBS 114405 TaxID=1182544 RepID=W9VYD4_9EURO|nr:uncharacterized protein A1O7_07608 [Cladophialophora yegresii CBS 114405]EXJ57261.1 hypothetical protein A1O7_07608 [Cladophialophora yegresii CBS 114405]